MVAHISSRNRECCKPPWSHTWNSCRVPCGQVSEGDDYLQSIWKGLANSCLLLLNQWVHSFHKLCEEFWRQSDKISVAIFVRIQQLVHQNFILAKQWPLQDQFLTQHCLQHLRALQRAKSRWIATFCISILFCTCIIAPSSLTQLAEYS